MYDMEAQSRFVQLCVQAAARDTAAVHDHETYSRASCQSLSGDIERRKDGFHIDRSETDTDFAPYGHWKVDLDHEAKVRIGFAGVFGTAEAGLRDTDAAGTPLPPE